MRTSAKAKDFMHSITRTPIKESDQCEMRKMQINVKRNGKEQIEANQQNLVSTGKEAEKKPRNIYNCPITVIWDRIECFPNE